VPPVAGKTACKWAGRCKNKMCIFSHPGDGGKISRARSRSPPPLRGELKRKVGSGELTQV
jgi:hypothetical protein